MPSTIILEMNNIDYHTYVHPSGNSRLILNNEEEPDVGDYIMSQKHSRNILAQYYIAAESVAHTESWNLFPPLDPSHTTPKIAGFPTRISQHRQYAGRYDLQSLSKLSPTTYFLQYHTAPHQSYI